MKFLDDEDVGSTLASSFHAYDSGFNWGQLGSPG